MSHKLLTTETNYTIGKKNKDTYAIYKLTKEGPKEIGILRGFIGQRIYECMALYGTEERNQQSKSLSKQPHNWDTNKFGDFSHSDPRLIESYKKIGLSEDQYPQSPIDDELNCWGATQYVVDPKIEQAISLKLGKRIDDPREHTSEFDPNILPQIVIFNTLTSIFEDESLKLFVDNTHEAVVIAIDDNTPIIFEKRGRGGICAIDKLTNSPFNKKSYAIHKNAFEACLKRNPEFIMLILEHIYTYMDFYIFYQEQISSLLSDKIRNDIDREKLYNNLIINNGFVFMTIEKYLEGIGGADVLEEWKL